MIGERIELWHKEEYHYPAAHGFIPIMVSYIHEDELMHPAMLVVPGGGYRLVSPSEAHLVAMEFYQAGYNVFVLEYTVNPLDEAPLKLQPLKDISRAMRMIRFRAEQLHILSDQIVVCGFSAGGHLCASLCVHGADIEDPDEKYQKFSNKPDAAVLSYPVITTGKYTHKDSFVALFGKNPTKKELEYMSIEKYVTKEIPPCFIWQTATDGTVPVQNSYLLAQKCLEEGVPFAHHVFSEGVHGMSVATEDWLERRGRQPYTQEQLRMLAEAILAGETSFSKEMGEELLVQNGNGRTQPPKWTAEQKEEIRKTLKEVQIWPKLAEEWLEKIIDYKGEAR